MASLYEIDKNIEAILDRLYAAVDEETGEVPDDILLELSEMQETRTEKLDNIGAYIKNLEAEAAAIKAEMDNLKKRMEVKTRKADRLREYVKEELLGHDQMKMETARNVFSFRKSVVVNIPDESIVPKKYFVKVTTEKLDKATIKDLLKQGKKIKGAELLEKQNLQIK